MRPGGFDITIEKSGEIERAQWEVEIYPFCFAHTGSSKSKNLTKSCLPCGDLVAKFSGEWRRSAQQTDMRRDLRARQCESIKVKNTQVGNDLSIKVALDAEGLSISTENWVYRSTRLLTWDGGNNKFPIMVRCPLILVSPDKSQSFSHVMPPCPSQSSSPPGHFFHLSLSRHNIYQKRELAIQSDSNCFGPKRPPVFAISF